MAGAVERQARWRERDRARRVEMRDYLLLLSDALGRYGRKEDTPISLAFLREASDELSRLALAMRTGAE